jgi:hypothetical protein
MAMDRRRFLTVCLTMASAGLFGAGVPEAEPRPSRAHVYLLRGIFGLSTGMDVLAERLSRQGIRATVHGYGDAGTLAVQAARAYKDGSERPIILIGHSRGGSAALDMAEDLGRAGVPVALVIPIDPVGTTTVPSNVRRAVNFYVSDGMGSAVSKGANFRGQIANLDFKGQPDGGHMAIQSSDRIHRQIVGYVRAAL